LSDVHIREGNLRNGFTLVYHELFDVYHDYIGDKALLYYTFLLRYRNTEKGSDKYGKSWRGRRGVVEKFQFSYSALPLLDDVLNIAGLIDIETHPSGRGRDKIFYIVHDPSTREEFRRDEERIRSELLQLMKDKPDVSRIVGKEIKPKRKGRNN
jgi:hypothetical protein